MIRSMRRRWALPVTAAFLAGCAAMMREEGTHPASPYGEGPVAWHGRTVAAPLGVLVLKFRDEVPEDRRDLVRRLYQVRPARSEYEPAAEAVQVIFPETWQTALDSLAQRAEIEWVHPDLPPEQLR